MHRLFWNIAKEYKVLRASISANGLRRNLGGYEAKISNKKDYVNCTYWYCLT